jgi:hypothetical protein
VQRLLPERRADVLSEVQSDGSGLLYDPRTRYAIALNFTAVAVWEACDGTRQSAIIAEAIAADYDAPLDIICRDVDALLADLANHGLLVDDSAPIE